MGPPRSGRDGRDGRGKNQPRPRTQPARPPAARRSPTPARGLGGEQVEGRQAVRAVLAARRRRVRDIWLVDDVEASPILAEIRDLATSARVPIRPVSRERLQAEARTDAPQGVLAHADALPEADFEQLASRRRGGAAPFLVALDGVTDPHNLGALLRSAECAGVTGVLLPRHRAAHVTPAVTKAAAGAAEYVAMAVVPGLPSALAALKERGVWTVGLAADAPTSVFDLEVATEPVALVLGAEGRGLSRLVRQRCDLVVAIPQSGSTASLNVAAAGAIACFEIVRRRLTP